MPRRSGEQVVKPFELRTGVGGLPQLGGMFRSGDPATVPPHKFHLLVNMRRTPGGTITRPGLELVFNTGVQECINGLTEDAGEQGGALMLYPGAEPRDNSGELFNPATFRAVFPDSSDEYSEFASAIFGPAATARGVLSPVLSYINVEAVPSTAYVGPQWCSRPFIFRGQAVQFAIVDRNGTPELALLGINLSARSFLQASDCWRDSKRPNDGTTPTCPGLAGQPTPPIAADPPLWPFQHPLGSVGVLTYFDTPFGPADPTLQWRPDASCGRWPFIVAQTVEQTDIVVEQIIKIAERIDDVLTGTAGVNEVLYFVARKYEVGGPGGPIRRMLLRWDGAQQTTEFSAIPDDLLVALGEQAYGPYLVSYDLDGGPADWGAYRSQSGAWIVTGGIGWVVGPPPSGYLSKTMLYRGLSWGGKGQIVTANDYACGFFTSGGYVHTHDYTPGDAAWNADFTTPSSVAYQACEVYFTPEPVDAVVAGNYVYVLVKDGDTNGYHICWGEFGTLSPAANSVRLILDHPADPIIHPSVWIQEVGGRVYVGGRFDYEPESQVAAAEVYHGVFDVTNPGVVFGVYRVLESEQQEDSGNGGYQVERYSRGCLAAVPNDETGGQGFQAS